MLGAAGLLALGGCASTVYLDMVRKEPDERPSVVTDDFCKERWVQPCFAVTAMDFSAFGRVSENAAGKGGHMGSPFWLPVVFLDVPFSLCTDVVTMPARRFLDRFDSVRRFPIDLSFLATYILLHLIQAVLISVYGLF